MSTFWHCSRYITSAARCIGSAPYMPIIVKYRPISNGTNADITPAYNDNCFEPLINESWFKVGRYSVHLRWLIRDDKS